MEQGVQKHKTKAGKSAPAVVFLILITDDSDEE
jgi:hypothetical protein